ncbi:nucleolar zinc-finger protein [Xanthoria parietina]
MADSDEIDREDARESRESPFATLQKRVAGPKVEDDDNPPNGEEDKPKVVDRIESLCINCEENGETRLFLTKIPYFREIIIISFLYDYYSFDNTDIQSAGQIQERGAKYTLNITHLDNMERQIVKSDIAVLTVGWYSFAA